MGVRPRQRPKRLAEKLLAIRTALGLSQAQAVKYLDVEEMIVPGQISEFETDKREPTLPVLLRYARAAGVHMEDLVDDELDLPDKLPGTVRYQGIRRKPAAQSRSKRKSGLADTESAHERRPGKPRRGL